ncbi:hypothetical protein HOO31_02980 [Aliarcobacter cryaerophilus]|uniref:hypothetical protein n=1 Tax=Aliarcobacter cryaerophilus TaxID=28198 RepID=UPI00164BC971|nr:hypothetical protein [Aliarcobacter cryaerophilus]QNK85586.1 hypothetical protein HOO31_02980 [Aliarcobacter cryaerophilus]
MNSKKYVGRDDNSINIKNSNITNSFNNTTNIDIVKNAKRWFNKTFQKEKYYQELLSLLNNQLHKKVEVQKSNKKYIPEIFLELNDIKEKLRYITQPMLFYKKEIKELKGVEFYFFNEVLEKLGFEKKEIYIEDNLTTPKSIDEIDNCIARLTKIFKEFKDSIPNLDERENLKQKMPSEQYELLLKEQGTHRRFEWFINKFEKKFNLLNKQLIFLTEKAGQGKTNLICDFVDKVMIKKNLLGVMFTGNEFNRLSQQQIEDVILKDIYGFQNTHITFDEFLDDIEYICNKNNAIFTIVIDGLNENSNIEQFSQELYRFVEKILVKKFIRLIFTCRSEYFEQRFNIFKEPSFNQKMLMMDNYMERYHRHDEELPEYLQNRLLDSYFKFFRVKSTVFDNVRHKLSDDFLLLRIFCEVYGEYTNPNAPTEQVYDIYKDDLFKKYFEYKKEEIKTKTGYSLTDFQQLFKVILAYMIDKHQYINIPFDSLNGINKELLNHIIDEDIFFRKDLVKDEASVFANKEVLNFTFDEFRDYLLADYLATDVLNIEVFVTSITTDETSIEGIKKYLFFKSRKSDYREKLKFLESLENYDELFLNNIFSVKDEDIEHEDIQKIKNLFISRYDFSKVIIHFLMFRHRTKIYQKLNIFTLFEIITTLDDSKYSELVNQKFKIKYDRYSYSKNRSGYLLDLLNQLDEILNERDFSKEYQFHNVFEFMFLLIGVEDESEYGKTPYELIELLEKYIEKYPEDAKKIFLKYSDIKILRIKLNIWKLINHYADKQMDFDSDFCQEVFDEMLKTEEQLLQNQYQYFLEKCYASNIELFNDKQKKFFEELEKEKEEQKAYFKNLMNGKIDIEFLYEDIET